MVDTIDPDERDECKGPKAGNFNPLDSMSNEKLEAELFNAIQYTSSACDGDSETYPEIDDDLGGEEEYEDEDERRRSTLRVLATMRPQLAALLGAQPAK